MATATKKPKTELAPGVETDSKGRIVAVNVTPEVARAMALRPDREKLLAVAKDVEGIVVPEVSDAAQEIADKVAFILTNASHEIRQWVCELS